MVFYLIDKSEEFNCQYIFNIQPELSESSKPNKLSSFPERDRFRGDTAQDDEFLKILAILLRFLNFAQRVK